MKKIAKIIVILLSLIIIVSDIILFIMAKNGCWLCFMQAGIIGMPWSAIFLLFFDNLIDLLDKLTTLLSIPFDIYIAEDTLSYLLLFLSQAVNIVIVYFIILWIGKIMNRNR